MSTEDVVEAMAKSAHDAWLGAVRGLGCTSRKAAWGEEFMVPFDDLSELGKEFDRIIMRAILRAFKDKGVKLVGTENLPDSEQRMAVCTECGKTFGIGATGITADVLGICPQCEHKPTRDDLAIDLLAKLETKFWHGVALSAMTQGRSPWSNVPLAALRRAHAAEQENKQLRNLLANNGEVE